MGIRILSLALLTIAVFSGRAPEQSEQVTKPEYEGNVLVLGDRTLADAVAQNEFLLLDIYAPWCGHCKTLEPIYARVAKILADKGSKVVLSKLDGTVHQQTVSNLAVKGYPHLVFYRDGQQEDYTGERNESDLMEFILKNTEIQSQYITTQQELKILNSASQIVLFMSCKSKNDEEFKVFVKYLTYYDDLVYAHSHEVSLVGESPFLVLHNKDLKKEVEFKEAYTIANLVDFVEKNTFSMVMNFGLRSAKKIFGQKSISVFLFFNSNSLHYKDLLEDYLETAQQYEGKIQFCQANQHNKQENSIYDYLSINDDQVPQIRIVDATSKELKEYIMDERPITEQNMLKFLKSYFDNKLTHYKLNQEDVPQLGFKIQPLSGIQFVEFIKEKRLHSVVYFFEDVLHNDNAIYGAIVNNFIGLRPIQFGAVDNILNLIESFRVYKVPCIFMFGHGKEPVEYFGAFDEKQVSEWIFKVYEQWWKN